MIDVKITNKNGSFKFRTCFILKHNDKILLTRMHDNSFYCLPGGHVELGESSYDGAIRECKEELGVDINIDKLLLINENFFNREDGKIFHELAYYYLCSPKDTKQINTKNFTLIENDKNRLIKHEIIWADKEMLENISFEPYQIKKFLFSNQPLQNIVTKQ